MLDYDVVTILPAKSSEAQPSRTIYCERVAMYKALDGQQTRRNCRILLLQRILKLQDSAPAHQNMVTYLNLYAIYTDISKDI